MANSRTGGAGGVGLFTVLGLIFVVLKLTDVIDWSWWWVTAPFWGPWVFMLFVLAGLILAYPFWKRARR